jgi:hypothetical protein
MSKHFKVGGRVRVVSVPDDVSFLIGKTGVIHEDYTGVISGNRYLTVVMDEMYMDGGIVRNDAIFFPEEIEAI